MIVSNSCRCEKCKKLLSYEERINIKAYRFIPDPQCSGSRSRVIDNYNLCDKCYSEYNKYTLNFFNRVSEIAEM